MRREIQAKLHEREEEATQEEEAHTDTTPPLERLVHWNRNYPLRDSNDRGGLLPILRVYTSTSTHTHT